MASPHKCERNTILPFKTQSSNIGQQVVTKTVEACGSREWLVYVFYNSINDPWTSHCCTSINTISHFNNLRYVKGSYNRPNDQQTSDSCTAIDTFSS